MTDQELKEKYSLSAHAFVSLIKALLARKVISHVDLLRRREMAVQRDLARETQFLAGLYICPNCSHPHPEPFETCPACGANPHDFPPAESVIDSLSTSSGHIDSLTTSGGHIYVEEVENTSDKEEIQEVEEVEEVRDEESRRETEKGDYAAGPQKGKKEEVDSRDAKKKKASPFKSIRSLFSKIRKK